MHHQPTVLVVSATNDRYGACRSMLDLLIGLPERGYQPRVALKTPGDLGPLLDAAGISWFPIQSRRWIGRRRSPLYCAHLRLEDLRTARQIARTQRFDLVHSNTLSSPIGAFMSARARVPHVWHMREAVDTQEGSAFLYGQWASARLIRRASRVVACSQHLVERTADYADPKKTNLLYDGLLSPTRDPLPHRPPLSKDRPLNLLIVGKIARRKGQRDALEALALLRRQGLDARLVAVGDGRPQEFAALKEFARELGVEEAVEWKGYVDPQPFYQACDISLMCGPREPLSRVAVESQVAGIPSVALRSGGLPEVVEHGVTGWLYDEGSPEGLAKSIMEAVDTPFDALREIRVEGRRRAFARFDRDRHRDGVAAIYRELGV